MAKIPRRREAERQVRLWGCLTGGSWDKLSTDSLQSKGWKRQKFWSRAWRKGDSAWWAAHVFSWDPSGANRKQTLEMMPSWLLKAICPKPSSLQELCSRKGPWTLRLWLLQNWKVLLVQCTNHTYSQDLIQRSVLIPNEHLAASSNSTILRGTPRYIKHIKVTLAICMYLMGLLKTFKWQIQLTSDTCLFLLTQSLQWAL